MYVISVIVSNFTCPPQRANLRQVSEIMMVSSSDYAWVCAWYSETEASQSADVSASKKEHFRNIHFIVSMLMLHEDVMLQKRWNYFQ